MQTKFNYIHYKSGVLVASNILSCGKYTREHRKKTR